MARQTLIVLEERCCTMVGFLKTFFSPEKKAAALEKKLQGAVSDNNQPKITSVYSKEFLLLFRENKADLLSHLVLSYTPAIQDTKPVETAISPDTLRQAVVFLEKNAFDSAALALCDKFGFTVHAIDILAKQGRANELPLRIKKDDGIDKDLLKQMVSSWEKYQGDIRKNQTMVSVLQNIARFAPESIPDNPRVKDITGQFGEAASLYLREGDLASAARCYENAGMYAEAGDLFEKIGDREGISRNAEASGDLEKALQFVVKPERKVRILIRMERFPEAREFAAGLESPQEYFDLIQEESGKCMAARIKNQHFTEALELSDFAGCGDSEREAIVVQGRQYLDRKIASATSEKDIALIVAEKVKLEERAGHFEEAARIAEEVLQDLHLASVLYEKANLFNRAIGAESGQQEGKNHVTIRLAELHEKGGNLLKAANFYESAGKYDKAYELYERIRHFDKAIECYQKIPDPLPSVLIRLYTETGEFEKVIGIYVKAGSFSDLERALSIAKARNLTSHVRAIEETLAKISRGNREDLERCFKKAREEVLGSYSPIFGIDFGTTNSAAVIFNKKSREVEIIPTPDGSLTEPSFFGVDDRNHPLFGEKARLRSLSAPQSVVSRVKRSLGGRGDFLVGGKKYRSEEIIALILQQLRSNAEAYLQSHVERRLTELLEDENLKFSREAVAGFLTEQGKYLSLQDIVLSVPAYFNDSQKRSTRDSAEIAGLRVRRLLHEPTAAALAYGYQKAYAGKLLVIDLGGGTLDISILDVGEGVYDVRTVGGDPNLGGSDIDTEMVRSVIRDIRATLGVEISQETHPTEIARLRDACEQLKINLSSVSSQTMELPYFLTRPKYSFTMKREELEELSRPILHRIRTSIEETITKSGSGVDHFLLVGSATKMPAVIQLAENTVRGKHVRGIDPGTAVAMGDAIEAAILSGDLRQTLLLDVIPYSLGIEVVKKGAKDEIEISRFFEKDTRIPTVKSNIYSTKKDNQPDVHIKIYQGESLQPEKNYFLGDFVLAGILPAPAGIPKIEVTFDIGSDCILTVTAKDKATGSHRSITLEGAVTLSPGEKEKISRRLKENAGLYSAEKELEKIRAEIGDLKSSVPKTIEDAERLIATFFELFHQKVEVSPHLYKADRVQSVIIQNMFIEKNQFLHGIPKYKDQFASTVSNENQAELKHLDFSDKKIIPRLQERIDTLTLYKKGLQNIKESVEKNVTHPVAAWVQVLQSLEADTETMSLPERAGYHLAAGRVSKAREILEQIASHDKGLTKETFGLLLTCYVRSGMTEEYRDAHRRYGYLFGIPYPDYNRLNTFLKSVDDSVFMIQHGAYSGSGFCIAPHLIITNRHVIEGSKPSEIRIIGKDRQYIPDHLELDPTNDLAVLRIPDTLRPFRLGEFDFVEPGEQVLAIGFPHPSSSVHSENIFVSKGIVNSIRNTKFSPERVIFIDAKIGSGMSGGPLINDLGEVVGIITLIHYEKNPVSLEDQPVALPVHLAKKFLPGPEFNQNRPDTPR